MAAFSSRGPTLDGRYKPDLVAPGTNIISVRSSEISGYGWGSIEGNDQYMYMGGTSMSTPLVAGTAALLREYLTVIKGFTIPSAALLKAALLNSAEDIFPGKYGTGLFQEIPHSPVPNNVQGWGRVNLSNSVYPEGTFEINYYDEQAGLNTSEYHEYSVTVYDNMRPLKINLVWTDYPGLPSAQGGLVNDLDLQITTPAQDVLYPDNAMLPSVAAELSFYNMSKLFHTSNNVAVKITPTAYPAQITAVNIGIHNTQSSPSEDILIEIYDDDSTGEMPGNNIYTATVSGLVHNNITNVLVNGPTIRDGSFYVVAKPESVNDEILQDNEDHGVSYYDNGTDWLPDTGYTSYIGATVFMPGSESSDFDRSNNAVGMTLTTPDIGEYSIKISGYNVAHGPQPYALVVSGEIVPPDCTDNDGDTYSPDGGACGTIDCDDTNNEIYPNAVEICNGVDDNCDGSGLLDTDTDKIIDECDNCPDTCNSEQLDSDQDDIGDVCDNDPGCETGCGNEACEIECLSDTDYDGIPDINDNCPNNCNIQQLDADDDWIGDVCDPEPGCEGCGSNSCESEC